MGSSIYLVLERRDMKDKHPVELTQEEIASMSISDLKKFRDKSFKELELAFARAKKKENDKEDYIHGALDIISKTCLQMHRRIEILEQYINELISDKAFEDQSIRDKDEPIN